MSTLHTYDKIVPDGPGLHVLERDGRRLISVSTPRGNYVDVPAPTDPADQQKLVEAVIGESVIIVSVAGLPEVTENRYGGLDANNLSYLNTLTAENARSAAMEYLALARHIEARDAAAKERERVEEERRNEQAAAWRHFALTVTGRPHSSIVGNDVAIVMDALIDAGIEPPALDESGRVLAGKEAGR
jgi:hypothetical protein